MNRKLSVKIKMGVIRPFFLGLLLWLSTVPFVQAQQGFAVQVASVQSRAEAVALVNGLRARGLHSYWVRSEVAGLTYYRIRVGGQFSTSKGAADYGRKLVREGFLNTYTVFKYEPVSEGGGAGAAAEKRRGQLSSQASPKNSSPTASPGTIVQAKSTSALPTERPVTDYLITGEPRQSSPPNTFNNAASSTSPPAVRSASTTGTSTNTAEPKRRPERGRLETRKVGDEIELDDFKEFAPQVLQASVENKGGMLVVTLLNRNTRHRFRGTVSLNLRQPNERDRSQPAMQIELAPGAENSFEVQGVGREGSYLLTIYDEQRTLQLMQQGALGPNSRQADIVSQSVPSTTLASAGSVPVEPEHYPGQIEPEAPALKSASYPGGKPADENIPVNEEPKNDSGNDPNQSGEIKVIVRQVAASSENLTVEFEILAPQPLGMLVMAVHTASMNDSKHAIMTTKQGRLPFLVPASDASGAISYELHDETGRLLASGSKAFQEIPKQ